MVLEIANNNKLLIFSYLLEGEMSATTDIEGVEIVDESEFRRMRRRTASNMKHSSPYTDLEEIDIDKIVDNVDEELRNPAKVSSAGHRESSYSKDSCNCTNQEQPQKSSSFVHRARGTLFLQGLYSVQSYKQSVSSVKKYC